MRIFNKSMGRCSTLFLLLFGMAGKASLAQYAPIKVYTTENVHSHNDYVQKTPFYNAYQNHFGSIEVDVFLVDSQLLVAHQLKAVSKDRTLQGMYIDPIVKAFKENSGRPYADRKTTFQLVVEMKSGTEEEVWALVKVLKKYPQVFDRSVNPLAVKIVLTGGRPKPTRFDAFPPYIYYDYAFVEKLNAAQLARVGMISLNYREYQKWNGQGELPSEERSKFIHLIDSAHSLGKKIRFWGGPDNPVAWTEFMNDHVDFINTDKIDELSAFLKAKN